MNSENHRATTQRPAQTISMNPGQKLYLISSGNGHTCFGFENARNHANQIARILHRPDLAFGPSDFASLEGYKKYEAAVAAWSQSPLSAQMYFEPGTSEDAARALDESYRAKRKVRLVMGDTATGEPWLDEYDAVGTIRRSTGTLKVPLLIEEGESGGSAILTANLLHIIEWKTGKTLFRHAAYREPVLSLQKLKLSQYPWTVQYKGSLLAQFKDMGKACAYIAFMHGVSVEPRLYR